MNVVRVNVNESMVFLVFLEVEVKNVFIVDIDVLYVIFNIKVVLSFNLLIIVGIIIEVNIEFKKIVDLVIDVDEVVRIEKGLECGENIVLNYKNVILVEKDEIFNVLEV